MTIQYGVDDAIKGYTFQHILYHVIDTVIAKLFTDDIKFGKQLLQHLTFAGIVCHHIKHDHIALLPITVDTSHMLLQAIRIPGDIPVNEQAAELQIDTLACSIRTDEYLRIWLHKLALRLATLIYRHASVNRGYRIAIIMQTLLKIKQGILMFCEDDQFLAINNTLRGKQMFEFLIFLLLLLLVIQRISHQIKLFHLLRLSLDFTGALRGRKQLQFLGVRENVVKCIALVILQIVKVVDVDIVEIFQFDTLFPQRRITLQFIS